MKRWIGTTCLLAGSPLLGVTSALAQQADTNQSTAATSNCQPNNSALTNSASNSCQSASASSNDQSLEEVTVTAPRRELLGTASTASEGVVDDQEIQLTPAYRPGQLLETVPGLTVTLHSGEGKANQYLMRGYNLDHGTDLETYVDGMPINQPTHAHGQGYTDLNFLIPELADEITYTKGPYYADVGDFGAVGSVRMSYRDTIADQAAASIGSFGFGRLFTAATQAVGQGQHLLEAVEAQHYDGPFVVPDDARKENVVLRYSDDGKDSGFSLTGMFYHQVWTNTTDIPFRAVPTVGYFGSLDPSDGGHAMRGSLSANYHSTLGPGQFQASAFYIYNTLNLYNNFTHFLVNPVNGDQEDQFENRNVLGSAASYRIPVNVAGFRNDLLVGALTRNDILDVGRLPSQGQVPLTAAQAVANCGLPGGPGQCASYSNHDDVNLFAGALYLQTTTHWSEQFRSVLGVRNDFQTGTDHDLLATLHQTFVNGAGMPTPYTNGGSQKQNLIQPKGSLIYTPLDNLEFYVSGGEGFHSADLRGVNQADRNPALGFPFTPLMARQIGEEVGVRGEYQKKVTVTLALYNLWQRSETIIDPDIGQDAAGPPSKRYGFEINATYAINKYLEFYGSVSANHARFTEDFDDGTGHLGRYITDAPGHAGSAAFYLHDLGPWSGGLEYRFIGDFPLSSGPCVNSAAQNDFGTNCATAPTALGQINGKGYGQLNLDVHYAFPMGWTASMGIYNLLNTHAPAAEFWYVDRLPGEPASGQADVHEHPLEPLMARFTIAKQF